MLEETIDKEPGIITIRQRGAAPPESMLIRIAGEVKGAMAGGMSLDRALLASGVRHLPEASRERIIDHIMRSGGVAMPAGGQPRSRSMAMPASLPVGP